MKTGITECRELEDESPHGERRGLKNKAKKNDNEAQSNFDPSVRRNEDYSKVAMITPVGSM